MSMSVLSVKLDHQISNFNYFLHWKGNACVLMEFLASTKQMQFEENVKVSHRCYHNYINHLILGNRHFKAGIFAEGV